MKDMDYFLYCKSLRMYVLQSNDIRFGRHQSVKGNVSFKVIVLYNGERLWEFIRTF